MDLDPEIRELPLPDKTQRPLRRPNPRAAPFDLATETPLSPPAMEPFVNIHEVAAFLQVKVSWLYEQVRLNRVPSYKVGAFRRFKLSELDAWARNHE